MRTFLLANIVAFSALFGVAAQAQPAPVGSYQQTCSDIGVRGTMLRATCQSFDQRYRETELSNFDSCAGDISNVNGVLACTAPNGSSQRAVRTSL
jgi:hypothetical protein